MSLEIMKRALWLTLAVMVGLFASDLIAAPGMQKVKYLADSIFEKDGKYIRLLGGSSWVLASPTSAFVWDDVIIVVKGPIAVAYLDGDEVVAKHVGGHNVTRTGYLTTVIEALGDGAVLRLADGSFLSVPEYDQYYTGWWLPPYKALLTRDKMYLWNLKKGKRVWVNPMK